VILQTVLVLVRLLTSDYRTLERLDLFAAKSKAGWADALSELLLSQAPGELTVLGQLAPCQACLETAVALFAKQPLCGLVDRTHRVTCAWTDVERCEIKAITWARGGVALNELELAWVSHASFTSSLSECGSVDGGYSGVVLKIVERLVSLRSAW